MRKKFQMALGSIMNSSQENTETPEREAGANENSRYHVIFHIQPLSKLAPGFRNSS